MNKLDMHMDSGGAGGAQQPSATERLGSRELAIRGITLLEKAIERDFGLKLQIGAEQEFSLTARDSKGKEAETALLNSRVLSKATADNDFFDSPLGRDHNAGYVRKFYKESDPHAYEVVFDHRKQRGAVTLARAIETTRGLITRDAESRHLHAGFSPVGPSQRWATSSRHTRHDPTYSMQISISLTDAQGENILNSATQGTDATHLGRLKYFTSYMLPVIKDTILLHAQDDDAFSRYYTNAVGSPPQHFSNAAGIKIRGLVQGVQREEGVRIENRYAGANADPYNVILATLAATYRALDSMHFSRGGGYTIPRIDEIYSNIGPMVGLASQGEENLRTGTYFRQVLNTLSEKEHPGEKLGDNFCNAILAERERAVQRGHSQKPEHTR